jgi:hypothetical protein
VVEVAVVVVQREIFQLNVYLEQVQVPLQSP